MEKKDRKQTFRESQKKRYEALKEQGYVSLNCMIKKDVRELITKFQKDNNLSTTGEAVEAIVKQLKSK